MHWGIGRSVVLNSIWGMDGIKVTLRCHAIVSRSVHQGTAATSTTTGLLLSLGWVQGRRMVISHSR